MFQQEANILEQIAASRNAIRKKHLNLKNGLQDVEDNMNQVFQPIIKPHDQLVNQTQNISKEKKKVQFQTSTPYKVFQSSLKKKDNKIPLSNYDNDESILPYEHKSSALISQDNQEDFYSFDNNFNETIPENKFHDDDDDDHHDEIITNNIEKQDKNKEITQNIEMKKKLTPEKQRGSLKNHINMSKSSNTQIDNVLGVRKFKDRLKLGNSTITFPDNKIRIGHHEFPQTYGLIELLFMKKPNDEVIQNSDIQIWKQLLDKTNALHKRFEKTGPIRSLNIPKYQKYIVNSLSKTGGLLPKYMVAKRFNYNSDYKYWDDVNELVDRLRLLTSERTAGNNAHENEILAIIEELREAKIIY